MPHAANATEENLTDLALERWQACHSPRFREIMQSLIQHLHGFVREVEPTREEWLFAANWLAKTGQLSTDKRQEFILLSDVLGVSMLVDSINHRLPGGATPSTVQGPFHIDGSPEMPMGADMATGLEGENCYVFGAVRDLEGRPIDGAENEPDVVLRFDPRREQHIGTGLLKGLQAPYGVADIRAAVEVIFGACGQREWETEGARRNGGMTDALRGQFQWIDRIAAVARGILNRAADDAGPGGLQNGHGHVLRVVAKAVLQVRADGQRGDLAHPGQMRHQAGLADTQIALRN